MPRASAGTRTRAGRGVFASLGRGPARSLPFQTDSALRRARARRDAGAVNPTAPKTASGLAGLSHVDRQGKARMVDVSAKPDTVREARARVTLRLQPATLRAIRRGEIVKGDVLGV